MKCFGLKALSLLISACYWVKDAIEQAIGTIFLITHAVSQCYFFSDPWALAYRWGSRPHLKPAAIKMSNDHLSLFISLQTSQPKWGSGEVLRASSEPETQCEYNRNTLITPVTIYPDEIKVWVAACPVYLVTTVFFVNDAQGKKWQGLGLSSGVCLCNIHQWLQRKAQCKFIEKNNDNNTQSGDSDILKWMGSFRGLTEWVWVSSA